ncbi:MAG: DNA polymerase III subunit gamma/tau [Pseudomonadota bacterium]
MEYQALARKYRPRNFASLMGQEHVSKALANALRSKRLHHAYLFSGTRGVGKTTIARILAKSLNCETGIVEEPCGQCSTCTEIDEGRFIDLIEVDAASKTKVEDTRDMLDNVQYAPVRGRFKIYLIDEVHMLSGHSFNALLKTLEEPPEHVKFLLATTDPQKLPITVLSRCLQFNLRHLSVQQIAQQLTIVLKQEQISFTADAISPIALAADGSMRDGLSLLDQAIAFADGDLTLSNIDAMLGNVPAQHIIGILTALVNNNAQQIMNELEQILSLGMGVDNVLTELINALQKMAMLLALPELLTEPSALQQNNSFEQNLFALSKRIGAQDIQLYYQIALAGRADLELSPFPQAALEMVLLRMLAFRPIQLPVAEYAVNNSSISNAPVAEKKKPLINSQSNVAENQATTTQAAPASSQSQNKPEIKDKLAGVADNKKPITNTQPDSVIKSAMNSTINNVPAKESKVANTIETAILEENHTQLHKSETSDLASFWNDCVYKITCVGIAKEILLHCCLLEKQKTENSLIIKLGLDSAHQALLNDSLRTRIKQQLAEFFSQNGALDLTTQAFIFDMKILADAGVKPLQTPKQIEKRQLQQQLEQAKKSIAEDANVQQLIEQFSGKIISNSIQVVN